MKRTYEMDISRVRIFTLFMLIGFLKGAPSSGRHHHHVGKSSLLKDAVAKQRSYIDIDASDPFKVPKSSHYINRPIPEFSQAKDDKEEENSEANHHERERPEKALENIDDDVKGLDISSLREGGGDKETKKERQSDGEEEQSNNEEQRDQRDQKEQREEKEQKEEKHASNDDSNNESSKEIELGQDAGKSIQNVEQDLQMRESLQNTDPGNDPEDGYKKTNVDPNDLQGYR